MKAEEKKSSPKEATASEKNEPKTERKSEKDDAHKQNQPTAKNTQKQTSNKNQQQQHNQQKNQRRQQQNNNQHKQQTSNQENNDKNKYRAANYEFEGIITAEGVLEIMPDNYGFLRSSDYNYLSSPDDVYVSHSQIRLFGLKTGDTITGEVRPPKEGEKYFPLIKINEINGRTPDYVRDRVSVDHLNPLFHKKRFKLSDSAVTLSTRVVDIFASIVNGQTGMR